MKRTGNITLTIGLFIVGLIAPNSVYAANVTVNTAQIIPVGANTCAPLTVQSVTPYIVDNELNSFDVTITDTQYVSILASVGDTGVPFNFMTRSMNADGALRIHVDIQATPIYGSLPVTMTLISAQTGQPVCLSTVSFSVLGNAAPAYHPEPIKGGNQPDTTPANAAATTTSVAPSTTTIIGSVTGIPLGERLQRACEGRGSFEVWFVLITLFLVGTAVVALAQPPMTKRHEALPSALISIPFVLLAAFWFFAPMCRGAGWVPFVLLAIAVVGVIVAYRDRRPVITSMIQLPPPAQKPVATTPSKQAVPAVKK